MAEHNKIGIDVGGVDPGALVLAGAGAAFSFAGQNGDWSPFALIVGLALTLVVVAYHHQAPGSGTMRHWLLRLAFSAVASLTVCIALAYPLQHLVMANYYSTTLDDYGNSIAGMKTTTTIYWIWPCLTIIFALLEPRLAGALDATRETSTKGAAVQDVDKKEAAPPAS